MSDVLVRQLQQVLAPWDSLGEDRETMAPNAASAEEEATVVNSWVGASSQDALAHARAATTKLELARAALALFTSNAGAFRPILVKVFRFLFDHIDALRDKVAHQSMVRLLWQQGEGVRAAATSKLNGEGNTPEEQNAIVAAYEKVHLAESRMSALIEEASVQRDHFKSQIEAQKKQQYHLEDLLQHQMELTQTLLDHRLRQELVGGGGVGAAQIPVAGDEAAGTTTEAYPVIRSLGGAAGQKSMLPFGGASISSTTLHAAEGAERRVGDPNSGAVNEDITEHRRRPAERRDAAYVQRLIQRADRELTLEKTEDQLRELRAQQEELEKKVQSLLKLNTKYARQCVELSARLSIIHENNIALAADVQLYQRDYIKEQQRSANLQHALLVARGIVLTTLQVQPGYQADEAQEQLDEIDRSYGNPQEKRFEAEDDTTAAQPSCWQKRAEKNPRSTTASTAIAATTNTTRTVTFADLPLQQLDPVNQVEEALRVVPSQELRRQLQEVLQVDDVDYGGKVKAALLKLLELQIALRAQQQSGVAASSSTSCTQWLVPTCTHQWAAPYGLRPTIPRHLRSAVTVPLLFLHPLLAEAFVHELLTQRQQLLAFAQAQVTEAKAHTQQQQQDTSLVDLSSGCGSSTGMQQSHLGAIATSSTFVSFSDFIELFVLVVWLNRADRYLPLLPSSEQTRLKEEAQIREEAHARRVSRLITKATGSTAGLDKNPDGGGRGDPLNITKTHVSHTSLWELRHVLHLVRPSIESAHLPYEGLQLTYALDVASRQASAGPLTYAYGITSRGSACEVLFYVLRAERETLLALCRAVDAAMVAHARSKRHPYGPADDRLLPTLSATAAATAGPFEESKNACPQSVKTVNGWIPTVQFIRILLVMYPGYPVRKVEQLIAAAVADGTTSGTESPAALFYEVLLPGRMLPGPTTAATTADTSIGTGTQFASLFYAAICDDALASMQVVEDSVYDFVRDQQQQQPRGAGTTHTSCASTGAVAGDAADVMVSVTARQITSKAFLGIPRAEARQWGAGLRCAINRWPQLRSTIADPVNTSSVSEASLTKLNEGTEEDKVSTVARVAAGEVMPYLRRNIIVRRGLFANAETDATATTLTSVSGSPMSLVEATMEGGSSATPKEPPGNVTTVAAAAAAATKATSAGSPKSTVLSKMQLDGWTPTHAMLLQQWEAQWAAYSNLPEGFNSGIEDADTQASFTVTEAEGKGASLGGPSQVSEFVEMLQQLDPCRTRPWGSELVSRDSTVLHPLDYAGDWAAEVLDAARRTIPKTATDAALKPALAKKGKRSGNKRAGGDR